MNSAAEQKIRRIHSWRTDSIGRFCVTCRTNWPCATLRALDGDES